jgi:UDPglucose--hexose-1-phosphate uridylyltransferase
MQPLAHEHELGGEMRQDLTSGRWVVIATGRSKRPHEFAINKIAPKKLPSYVATCPFCNLIEFPQEPDVLRLPNDPDTWQVHIFPNKYPAFSSKHEFKAWNIGPYRALEAMGYHEILATREHHKEDAQLSTSEMSLYLEALTLRYRELRVKPSVNYIQIIKNHGSEAGGSVEHAHHQIFATPILPQYISEALHHAEAYAKKHKTSVFTTMLNFELEQGSRLVYQNDHFVAFCPFASRVPFEVWIFPRQAQPYFENIGPQEREALADAMIEVLSRMFKGLNDPPYNYYIHSAPCDDTGFVCNLSTFQHFSWHVEIVPRLSKLGGFEFGTGMEINTAMPEESASFLRNIN